MKHRYLIIFFIATSVVSAQNQRPIKKNLFLYFDKVPVPPATCKEAHQKCFCDPNYTGTCNSDTVFNAFLEEVVRLQNDISLPPGSPQGDMVKKMQDPEFQKKMQSMSQEEKIQMAMQMSQAMTPGPMQPERPSVTAALKAFGELNEAEAESAEKFGEAAQKQMQEQQELETKHKGVDEWVEQEIKKLPPTPSTGESGGPEPKQVYKVQMNGWNKHLAIVDEWLKKSNKAWAEEKARLKKQYEPYETALQKTHYGDDARNGITKSNLGSGQVLMLNAVQKLVASSKAQYDEGAAWYERMLVFQKQNEYLFHEQ